MRYVLLIFSLGLLAGCATIVNGTAQDVNLMSSPAGAKVYVNGEYQGETPLTVALSRRDYHDVRLEKSGYEDYQETIGRTWSPWVLGNWCVPPFGICGLMIFVPVDYVTGGSHELGPSRIDAEMRPLANSEPAPPQTSEPESRPPTKPAAKMPEKAPVTPGK